MAQEYLPFVWTRQDPYVAGLGWNGNSQSFLNAASVLPGAWAMLNANDWNRKDIYLKLIAFED